MTENGVEENGEVESTSPPPVITDFCESEPDFAVICSFFDKFGTACGIQYPSISELEVKFAASYDKLKSNK